MKSLICNLINNNYTIATAESVTGGKIASAISEYAGVSKIFRGSIVSYQTEMKVKLLNIEKEIIIKYGVISSECAEAMAKNCAKIFEVDIAISATGIAGKYAVEGKKSGTVYVGIYYFGCVEVLHLQLDGSRIQIQKKVVKKVFEKLNDIANSKKSLL